MKFIFDLSCLAFYLKINVSRCFKIKHLEYLGDGQELDDISSGDEDSDGEEDVQDGIELGIRQQQYCDDLECDHSANMTECKIRLQYKNIRSRKKTARRKTPMEVVSDSWKWVETLMYSFFCISTKNILGKWRFTRNLQWHSTSEFLNRLVIIGDKVNLIVNI